jgi:hypothetical protein
MNPARIAYDDQYRAAASDARRQIDQTAARSGSAVRKSDASWIREWFSEFARAMAAGKGTLCPHIGCSPMVAHTAAWVTDHLVCAACIGTLQPPADEEGRCDRCGQPGPPLHTGSAAHGPVLMAYRLCTPCIHAAT